MPKLGRTTPCEMCPWRVSAAPGYLGEDSPVHFYWASISAEQDMPCHEQIDYSEDDWKETQLPGADLCAGMLIHFKNSLKRPRRPEIAAAVEAVKESRAVFQWPWDFMKRHMPGATEAEIKEAWHRAGSPFPVE